jgi:hypothetical protein
VFPAYFILAKMRAVCANDASHPVSLCNIANARSPDTSCLLLSHSFLRIGSNTPRAHQTSHFPAGALPLPLDLQLKYTDVVHHMVSVRDVSRRLDVRTLHRLNGNLRTARLIATSSCTPLRTFWSSQDWTENTSLNESLPGLYRIMSCSTVEPEL